MLTFGSVCSGIEAASVAWEPLGWRAVWLAEFDAFPSAVLAHHWPSVPNFGDMYTVRPMLDLGVVAAPDVLVGGTPCQAFSVAGARKGLNDERGQLTLEYVRILNAIDDQRAATGRPPCVAVWENVPGVLSDKTNAFGCLLAAIVGDTEPLQPDGGKWGNAGVAVGPERSAAWRVLDAQYFGVAQRRRRVFVVASARNDFDPAQVLLEFDGVRRDIAPSRSEGQDAAAFTASSFGKYSAGVGTLRAEGGDIGGGSETLTVGLDVDVCGTITAGFGKLGAPEVDAYTAIPAYGMPGNWIDRAPHHGGNSITPMLEIAPCQTTNDKHGVAYGFNSNAQADQLRLNQEAAETLTRSQYAAVASQLQVRRLTPTECERLQGFPDGHTAIPYRNKPADQCPDGPRYKALGNSMAVPVMRWIGQRINDALQEQTQ